MQSRLVHRVLFVMAIGADDLVQGYCAGDESLWLEKCSGPCSSAFEYCLKFLYDLDIVSEDSIIEWAEEAEESETQRRCVHTFAWCVSHYLMSTTTVGMLLHARVSQSF